MTRFIPASAGNGYPQPYPSGAETVHPRERGERGDVFYRINRDRGSSPRARGTAGAATWSYVDLRFIPASAGNGKRQ